MADTATPADDAAAIAAPSIRGGLNPEASRLFRAYRTISNMLDRRGYMIPREMREMTPASFKQRFGEQPSRESLTILVVRIVLYIWMCSGWTCAIVGCNMTSGSRRLTFYVFLCVFLTFDYLSVVLNGMEWIGSLSAHLPIVLIKYKYKSSPTIHKRHNNVQQ